MDVTQMGIVATSLGVARDISRALLGIRDFNLVAENVAALNDQLLKAQDALLAHNTLLFQLQNEKFETAKQLRELQETLSERGRYTLVDLGKGQLAYRMNVVPAPGATTQPLLAEAPHYICQSCYDNGRKVVLQRNYYMGNPGGLNCGNCRATVFD